MPASKSRIQLDELLALQEPENRFLDLCLVLRREKTRETLLWAGGRWDLLDKRWSDQEPETGEIIDLHEGQVEFTRWYATWLRDFREGMPRDASLALAGGERRGGKTFDLVCCFLATLIDVPVSKGTASTGWMVSVAHSEADELHTTLKRLLPAHWFRHRAHPRHVYEFVHGARAFNVSADDPETLKRGRADVVFLNEAQKMPSAVLENSIGGTVDAGGIAILAANPPQRSKGEWVYDVREAIENGELAGVAKFFGFDAKLNPHIDQGAKRRVGKLLRFINPAAAAADDEGVWKRPGDMAYEAFGAANRREAPKLGDITEAFTKKRIGIAYPYIGGYDPNNRPHHVGTVWKVYGTIAEPILWCVDEIVVDNADGEEHFLEVVDDKGYSPQSIVWICDNSCFWQNDKHRQNGVVSADYFKKWGYRAEMNQPPAPNSKTGRARNPDIELRVALLNKLMHSDVDAGTHPRLYVSPECSMLLRALKNCKSKKVRHGYGPVGREAHITDSAGYVAWWAFPKPKAPNKGGSVHKTIELNRPSWT